MGYQNFSDMHIDAKFQEEAISEVIFLSTTRENGQKLRSITWFVNLIKFKISENIIESYFLTIFSGVYRQNNPRIGFPTKFYVDMYITKNFLRPFSRFSNYCFNKRYALLQQAVRSAKGIPLVETGARIRHAWHVSHTVA